MDGQPQDTPATPRARRQVRLPGFVSDESIGVGTLLTRATSSVGIRPCGGCRRRADTLDRWLAVTGRHTTGSTPARATDWSRS